MKERIMTSEKAEKILGIIRRDDKKTLKHWSPYRGPSDSSFAVLNAPQKGLEEKEERREVGNG